MAKHLGISDDVILLQWESKTTDYQHLPHRLEKIGFKKQKIIDINRNEKRVTIVNDSKATNMESTFVALKSFQEPIRLLLGGQPKGDSYLPLINFVGHGLIKIYPFGKAGNLIASELKACGHAVSRPLPHLIQAAEFALSECQDGEVLLLSPGCSSFDEFKDFEHRGNTFRKWAISCFKGNTN
jgi:UDP-N-acetylmuramoylalanine--D-glutamate ligase